MDNERYSLLEILQIKGSFAYIIGITAVTFIALGFMTVASVKAADIVPLALLTLIDIFIAFIIYRLKKARKKTGASVMDNGVFNGYDAHLREIQLRHP